VRAAAAPSAPVLPSLPERLAFTPVAFGGEQWVEARVPDTSSSTVPFYLTMEQHTALERFINERPSTRQQLLMPVGSIKSGKTTVLHTVLPCMVAEAYATRWRSGRRRPAIFTYTFPLGSDAEDAAKDLQDALDAFGQRINVRSNKDATPSSALNNLPIRLAEFAESVKAGGGELWLLLDEIQAPILASTPKMAQQFTYKFKQVSVRPTPSHGLVHTRFRFILRYARALAPDCYLTSTLPLRAPSHRPNTDAIAIILPLLVSQVVEACAPLGRIAVTGSGLVAVLNAFRTARVNGFALWDAVTYLSLGSEPSPAALQPMAAAIWEAYSADWPDTAKTAITASNVVDILRRDASNGLMSPRPALFAYTLGRMGDARTGSADDVMTAAVASAESKLLQESVRDTAVALASLSLPERRILRAIAEEKYTCGELRAIAAKKPGAGFREGTAGADPRLLASLLICLQDQGTRSVCMHMEGVPRLCMHEEGTPCLCPRKQDSPCSCSPFRLQPPYPQLLLSWLTEQGDLAVAINGDKISVADAVRNNLVLIWENRAAVPKTLRVHVSHAVMDSLAKNGVGVTGLQAGAPARAPQTAAEFADVRALRGLKTALERNFQHGSANEPTLSAFLRKDASKPSPAAKAAASHFRDNVGWEVLLGFRHFQAHNWGSAEHLTRNGLTASVVADAVHAAASVLTRTQGGCFVYDAARPDDLALPAATGGLRPRALA
jgi:hypothetical protein